MHSIPTVGPSPNLGPADLQDYFIDLLEELAACALDLGEHEVALLLEATVQARRRALTRQNPKDPKSAVSVRSTGDR